MGIFGDPATFIEKSLKLPATTRNWNTVLEIVALTKVKL